jgi:hypothetical protein
MTRETFRTDYEPSRSYLVSGEILNRMGRSLTGVQGDGRTSGIDGRYGVVSTVTAKSPSRSVGTLWVQNGTPEERPPYQCLQLGAGVGEDWDAASGALWVSAFTERTKRIAVLSDLTEPGGLGHAQGAGICPCWVDVKNTRHPRAYPKEVGDVMLTSGFAGPATLISIPPATGPQICLVRLGEPNAVQLLLLCPSTGIPAATYELDGSTPKSVTPGEAECAVWFWDSAQGKEVPLMSYDEPPVAVTQAVKNFAPDPIDGGTNGKLIHAFSDDDYEFIAIVDYCRNGFDA